MPVGDVPDGPPPPNLPCCGAMVAALSLKPRHIVEGSAAASRDSLGRFLLQLLDWDEAAYSAFPTTPRGPLAGPHPLPPTPGVGRPIRTGGRQPRSVWR